MVASASGDFFFQNMYQKLTIIFNSLTTFLEIKIVAFNKEKTNQNTSFCMSIFFSIVCYPRICTFEFLF